MVPEAIVGEVTGEGGKEVLDGLIKRYLW